MQIDPINESNKKDLSKPYKKANDSFICKDGFCTLPNQDQNHLNISENINLFDPI